MHLNDGDDGQEEEVLDDRPLQLDVGVDTEAEAVKRVVNAVALLINLLLRPH